MLTLAQRLEIHTTLIADEIQKYSQSQVALWNRVPWHALQVEEPPNENGHFKACNYRCQLSLAWKSGFWMVGHAHVDLATGKLVHVYFNTMTITGPASKEVLLEIATTQFLEELDAGALVASLMRGSQNFASERTRQWRKNMEYKLSLRRDYRRAA